VARSTFFYTDSRVLGGAEGAMFMLLESLDREEWRPTLLLDEAPGVEPLVQRAERVGVPVRRVPASPLGVAGARRVPAMARLLRRERPDVFHAHMSSPVACKWALAAAVLARVPAVLGTVQVGRYEPPNRSAYWQLRLLARGVERYLAVSREIAGELVERLGWPAAKVEVVYNAVDPERFAVAASPDPREQLGGSEGRPLVLTAARLDPQKGHPALLEAATRVPEAIFVLAGEGPRRERLEELAGELGIADRVRFLGRREDVPRLLAACDVFALPSLYEGSSLAVLEAMASGTPVVGSAVGGTDELIEDGRTGLLVPPGDPGALAAALRRLLANPELRTELAARARERVERDLTRERMAARVTAVYRELLGEGPAASVEEAGAEAAEEPERLPESRRNPELRRRDWRFLVPGGELVRRWRLPHPGGARRVRRRLEAAGYADVHVYWPGPLPHRLPHFWLPVDSPEAVEYLLATRGRGSLADRALRPLWRLAHRLGSLAPLYVVGRPPGERPADAVPLPTSASLLLLTGGHRSINKAVGLVIEPGRSEPSTAIKFARVPEAEPGLEREAKVLARLNRDHPDLRGVPRLRGTWRPAGRLAVGEDAVEGESMLDVLDAGNFGELARRVSDLLVGLADPERRPPAAGWRERLVERPLGDFERQFGAALGPDVIAAARSRLAGLGEVPAACEHRDCSPWNVLLTAAGEPVLLDWESAEPDGLAGLDLVYLLANCAFVLDGAIEKGETRASYARLLDPSTATGRVAAEAFTDYSAAAGIEPEDLARLRLLCWIVHSRSDYRHLELEAGGKPSPEALRAGMFASLVQEELRGTPKFGPL
jgi:glycosyltransferase involved in cell wall biosynthesis